MQKHVKTLARRARHLWGKLDGKPDYNGRLYDQSEYEALDWALGSLGAPLGMEPPRPPFDDEDGLAPVIDDDPPPPRLDSWAPGAKARKPVPVEPRGKRYWVL